MGKRFYCMGGRSRAMKIDIEKIIISQRTEHDCIEDCIYPTVNAKECSQAITDHLVEWLESDIIRTEEICDWGNGYNQAIDNLIKELKGE